MLIMILFCERKRMLLTVLLKMLLEIQLLKMLKRRIRRRKKRERIRLFSCYRQFQIIAIFQLYDPSSFDLCARPGLEVYWKGGEAVSLHPHRYPRHPPLLYRKIVKRYAKPATAVEEQVVVTSARDLRSPQSTITCLSKSKLLYLCLRPEACRKTMTPPIAARTGTRTPARAKEDT
jgi:hypothetical protein